MNCTSLYRIDLPEGVRSILDGAFYGCTSLGAVGAPHTLYSVGVGAFYGCKSLSRVEYRGTAEQFAQIKVSDSNEYFLNAELREVSE